MWPADTDAQDVGLGDITDRLRCFITRLDQPPVELAEPALLTVAANGRSATAADALRHSLSPDHTDRHASSGPAYVTGTTGIAALTLKSMVNSVCDLLGTDPHDSIVT